MDHKSHYIIVIWYIIYIYIWYCNYYILYIYYISMIFYHQSYHYLWWLDPTDTDHFRGVQQWKAFTKLECFNRSSRKHWTEQWLWWVQNLGGFKTLKKIQCLKIEKTLMKSVDSNVKRPVCCVGDLYIYPGCPPLKWFTDHHTLTWIFTRQSCFKCI